MSDRNINNNNSNAFQLSYSKTNYNFKDNEWNSLDNEMNRSLVFLCRVFVIQSIGKIVYNKR